jgi:tRNA-specific 2-thiouridylase
MRDGKTRPINPCYNGDILLNLSLIGSFCNMPENPLRIVVAMSGGVDSSVAAGMLVADGHEVTAAMMRLWSDPSVENLCCTPDSQEIARSVATQLDIPFHIIDAVSIFRKNVVRYFIDCYKQGRTPNPCVVCNRQVRWELLLAEAKAIGANFIATGHYARIKVNDNGRSLLLRGVDKNKDQSYVLHGLTQDQLSRTILPLGNYTKQEIRQVARRFNLPVAERPDSQDLCFVGTDGYRDFLIRHAPEVIFPGPIVNRGGKVLGQHRGLAFYTIGQRKGLGIAGPQPYYVIGKDLPHNALVIGTSQEQGEDQLTAEQVNWISGETPLQPFRARIKIRYKALDTWGLITPIDNINVHIKFDKSLKDITPGQAAVFYLGEICLGGGIIK